MSFIITLYVREGIVMASDSRITLNATQQQPNQTTVHFAVGQSDSNYKTFLAPNHIGISTCGAAEIQGVPIAGYIESFITERLSDGNRQVDEVPGMLVDYFRTQPGPPATVFHVAGYKTHEGKRKPQVWSVRVQTGETTCVTNTGELGATWDGEGDILQRLMYKVGIVDQAGNLQMLPAYEFPLQFFTLQDAIEFAVYALKTTIDSIRFQARPKTVGGPIDVLVIKPDSAFWVQRKELHV